MVAGELEARWNRALVAVAGVEAKIAAHDRSIPQQAVAPVSLADLATDLEQAPDGGAHAMVRLLTRIVGVGIETADMLVQEVLSRNLRDRRAAARYAGLTKSVSREIGGSSAGVSCSSAALVRSRGSARWPWFQLWELPRWGSPCWPDCRLHRPGSSTCRA